MRGDHFLVSPCIPGDWPEFALTFRRGQAVYEIQVLNPDNVQSGVKTVVVDGEPVADHRIMFGADGQPRKVRVVVRMG